MLGAAYDRAVLKLAMVDILAATGKWVQCKAEQPL